MPDILTAERALEMARYFLVGRLELSAVDEPPCPVLKDIALFALRGRSAEASEEVCVCGHPVAKHYKRTTSHLCDCYKPDGYPCECKGPVSRRAFLEQQVKELEKL